MTMTICLAPSLCVSMKYIYGNKMENQGIVLRISTAQSGRKQNTSMTTFWKKMFNLHPQPKADKPMRSTGKLRCAIFPAYIWHLG